MQCAYIPVSTPRNQCLQHPLASSPPPTSRVTFGGRVPDLSGVHGGRCSQASLRHGGGSHAPTAAVPAQLPIKYSPVSITDILPGGTSGRWADKAVLLRLCHTPAPGASCCLLLLLPPAPAASCSCCLLVLLPPAPAASCSYCLLLGTAQFSPGAAPGQVVQSGSYLIILFTATRPLPAGAPLLLRSSPSLPLLGVSRGHGLSHGKCQYPVDPFRQNF